MMINRVWAMPNKNTFEIKPIKDLIVRHMVVGMVIDPFANSNKMATVTNDIDPSCGADFCLDAIDFLKRFGNNSVDMVLYDPPYSPRQVAECYRKFDRTVNMATTQSSYWGAQKREISRIVKQGGKVITFGWNSGGMGLQNGFKTTEILLVPHGGWHNDTICVVDKKV